MPVLAAYLYRNGKRLRNVRFDEAVNCSEDRSAFVWVEVADPTDDEMLALKRSHGLHPLAVEAALKPNQTPKLNIYGDQLFMIACSTRLNSDTIVYEETAVFVGRSHVICVRLGASHDQTVLRAQLEAAPLLLAHGVDHVLHAILDSIVDTYFPVVEMLEDEVNAMEQHTLDSFLERQEVRRIFDLRHELSHFTRTLRLMGEVASKLASLDLPCLDRDMKAYFHDALDHIRHAQTNVDGLRDILSAVFEFSSLLEQQRTGVITRQLAAWAAILAVPTAIAGIYGMNFAYMPELSLPGGYFVVLAVMSGLCSLLYVRFKRARWL